MKEKDKIKCHLRLKSKTCGLQAATAESDRYLSAKVPRKKKERNGVLEVRKEQGHKTPKTKGSQNHYVLCRKAEIPEHKFKSHIS